MTVNSDAANALSIDAITSKEGVVLRTTTGVVERIEANGFTAVCEDITGKSGWWTYETIADGAFKNGAACS